MNKWIILAVGILLTANGFYTRTFSFENETPNRYCFYMDLIDFNGCFHNATAPWLVAWGSLVIGLGFVLWSVLRRHRKST